MSTPTETLDAYGDALGDAINAAIANGACEPLLESPTTAVSVVATVGGGTTGLIPAGTRFAAVTSANADYQISLPAGTPGADIRLSIGSTGCELIAVTAADKVNNVTVGATNELALAASTVYQCVYVSANNWTVTALTNVGAPKLMTTAALTTITHTAPTPDYAIQDTKAAIPTTAALTTITFTAPTPDYAIQNLTQTTPYGFVTIDEGNTVLSVVANLQARVNEIETKSVWGFADHHEANTVLAVIANLQARVNQLELASALIPDTL